ncbi:hypothetical protein ACFL4N_07020 [Thermodesulfobacteriota bacterium]
MINRFRPIFTAGTMICVLCLSTALIQPIFAEDREVPRLHDRIAELEARVKHLEALLVKSLVNDRRDKSIKYGWENKKNWRKLKIGMDEKKVKGILGEPVKIIKGTKTLWYYPNYYCGYVSFDESGQITGWNEP